MYPPKNKSRITGSWKGKMMSKAFSGRPKASMPCAVNTRKQAIPRIPYDKSAPADFWDLRLGRRCRGGEIHRPIECLSSEASRYSSRKARADVSSMSKKWTNLFYPRKVRRGRGKSLKERLGSNRNTILISCSVTGAIISPYKSPPTNNQFLQSDRRNDRR